MRSPIWPAKVISRRLTDYVLQSRPDGTTTEMVITTPFDNGHVSVSRYSTQVTYHDWGRESVATVALHNPPPQMRPSEIPVKIHRSLRASKKNGDKFETLIEGRIEYADGSQQELSHVVGFTYEAARARLGTEQEERQKLAASIQQGFPPRSATAVGLIPDPITDFGTD